MECTRCPRLAAFIAENKIKFPSFFNAPVPPFGDSNASLLIVGLAPGLKGANQTGRPFTKDYAGDLLYPTLIKYGWAKGEYKADPHDGLILTGALITNAVRCVPPQNKVTPEEIRTCNPFLQETIKKLPNLKIILSLGAVSHSAVLTAFGLKKSAYPFGHATIHKLPNGIILIDSYHCSRYNTNTGVLTTEMFEDIFKKIKKLMNSKEG